jgi:hypothetical protein
MRGSFSHSGMYTDERGDVPALPWPCARYNRLLYRPIALTNACRAGFNARGCLRLLSMSMLPIRHVPLLSTFSYMVYSSCTVRLFCSDHGTGLVYVHHGFLFVVVVVSGSSYTIRSDRLGIP